MKYRVTCQTDIDYLARKERYKDLLREAERERLTETIQPKQPVLWSHATKWLAELAARRPKRLQSESVMPKHQS